MFSLVFASEFAALLLLRKIELLSWFCMCVCVSMIEWECVSEYEEWVSAWESKTECACEIDSVREGVYQREGAKES